MPSREDDAVSMIPSPHFDRTINYGHVLTVVALVVTLGGGIIVNAKEQAVLVMRVETLEKTTQIELARIRAESDARVAQYVPTINAFSKSKDLQDERISNVVDAIKEMRTGFAASSAILSEIRQDIAVMRVQAQLPSRPIVNPRAN